MPDIPRPMHRGRDRGRAKGMNKTEHDFLEFYLKPRMTDAWPVEEERIHTIHFEGLKLRVGGCGDAHKRSYLTPDFACEMMNDELWIYEVKGRWEEDALAKMKAGVMQWPRFRWFSAQRGRRGEWKIVGGVVTRMRQQIEDRIDKATAKGEEIMSAKPAAGGEGPSIDEAVWQGQVLAVEIEIGTLQWVLGLLEEWDKEMEAHLESGKGLVNPHDAPETPSEAPVSPYMNLEEAFTFTKLEDRVGALEAWRERVRA